MYSYEYIARQPIFPANKSRMLHMDSGGIFSLVLSTPTKAFADRPS